MQSTNLDKFIPSGGNDDGVGRVGGEADLADPLGVSILDNVILAFTKRVPQLDTLVPTSTDNLSVIRAKGDAQDVVGVAHEATGGESSVEVPETQGLVPAGREGKLAVRGDDNVLDKVVVSGKGTTGIAVLLSIASQVPDDNSLV